MADLNQRDRSFDIMKGIGILLVMICHFWGWYHPVLSRTISSFHMPMFFIVAGYFSKSYTNSENTKKTLKRYFSRLCIPMILTQLLIVSWAAVMAVVKGDGWAPVIRESLSLPWADPHGAETPWGQLSLGVIWFLGALFVAKSILLLFLSRVKSWALPLSLLLAVTTMLIYKVFPYSIWCISLGLMALPFVTLGWWLQDHSIPLWICLVSIVCWILGVTFSHVDMYLFEWKMYPLDLVAACGGTYVLFIISRWVDGHLRVLPKLLAYLGVISLAIMCVHGFEISSHLGNHLKALLGLNLSVDGLGIWRILATLAMALLLVHTPKVKRLFI